MSAFSSSELLNQIMHELWTQIAADPDMSSKLLASRLVTQFSYRDPDGLITIDCSNGEDMNVIVGPCNLKPIVEMAMKSDIAHEFWLGKVSIPIAILSGKITSKGPVNRALSLLPVLKPAYAMYPGIYEKWNRSAVATN